MHPGQCVEQRLLVVRQHPAQVLLRADTAPVGRVDAGEPGRRDDRGVGAVERRRDVVGDLRAAALDPEIETLVHGDLEGGGQVQHVLQARTVARPLRRQGAPRARRA